MTDARDQVLTTLRSFFLFIVSMRPNSRASTNGPFLTDLLIVRSPLLAVPRTDDQPVRSVVLLAGPMTHRRLAPWRLGRHPGRGLAFAPAMRVVARRHSHAPDLGTLAHKTGA